MSQFDEPLPVSTIVPSTYGVLVHGRLRQLYFSMSGYLEYLYVPSAEVTAKVSLVLPAWAQPASIWLRAPAPPSAAKVPALRTRLRGTRAASRLRLRRCSW